MALSSCLLPIYAGLAICGTSFAMRPGEEIKIILRSAADSNCVQVKEGSLADGGRIDTAPCQLLPHQSWLLRYLGEGYYLVSAAHSRKCFDVSAPTISAVIHQWTRHEAPNQRWQFQPQSTGAYKLIAQSSAMCATLQRMAEGNFIVQLPCQNLAEQDWLVEVQGE